MSAKPTQANGEEFTEVEQKAIEIIETAGEKDTVLFNNRVQPLTVERVMGPYEGKSGFDYLELEGPRGGTYMLVHRERSIGGEVVKLRRKTGQYDDEHGFPEYEDLNLTDIELVDHHEWRIGQVYEVPEPIRGEEYYHVVTGLGGSSCYDVETVGVFVEDGKVEDTKESGFFNSTDKEKVFNGALELVDELEVGYSGDRGVHYDTERNEEVRLSDPHRRGVDLRPTEGSGLEVVGWETILFGFDERFQEEEQRLVTDGGVEHSNRPPNKYEQAKERALDDLTRTELTNMVYDLPGVCELLVDGEDEDWRPTEITVGFASDKGTATSEVLTVMRRQGWQAAHIVFSPYNRVTFKECGSDD